MATENTEQRQVETRAIIEAIPVTNIVRKELLWLLEVVDKADERRHGEAEWFLRQLEGVQKKRDLLQERVRELEQHFSDEANSEHMPTSGDLL